MSLIKTMMMKTINKEKKMMMKHQQLKIIINQI